MANNNKIKDNNPLNGEIIIYENAEGQSRVSVRVEGETVWLNQVQMVDLFQSSKANVSEHIKHIFEEGELEKNSVVRKFRTTAQRTGLLIESLCPNKLPHFLTVAITRVTVRAYLMGGDYNAKKTYCYNK